MTNNRLKIFIAVIMLIVFSGGCAALSNAGGGTWAKYMDISITNQGSGLSQYQVLVQLTGGSFPTSSRPDGADIRFADTSGTELSYWIENWNTVGKNAKIWINIPNLPAGTTNVRMFSGNPVASSSSNGDATFEFFDDFPGTTLNLTKWDERLQKTPGGGTVVSNSELTISSIGGAPWTDNTVRSLFSKTSYSYNYALRTRIKTDWIGLGYDNSGYRHRHFGFSDQDLSTTNNGVFYLVDENNFSFIVANGGISNFGANTGSPQNYHIYDMVRLNDKVRFWLDDAYVYDITSSPSANLYLVLQVRTWDNSLTATINSDWILVRKYAFPEPAIALGTEQPIPTPIAIPPTAVPPTTVPPTTVPPTTVPPTTVPPSLGAQSNATTIQTSTAISKSASITGKVLDSKTDDPVQGATISIDGRSAATDSNGEYELAIDVGKHSLSVNKQGYETVTRSIIVPEVGTMLDLSLKSTSSDSTWLWIVVILLIVVVSAGIIYLLYKRKKKEKVEVKKEEKKGERTVEKKKFCMFCHAPIALDSDYCNKCGKKQDETKRFCMSCGALMPSVPEICGKCKMNPPSGDDTKNCRNCGEVIPVVAKFCSACGAGQPD